MDSAAIVAFLNVLIIPRVPFVFYSYLPMNRRTKAYFSRQSVEIRRQAQSRGR